MRSTKAGDEIIKKSESILSYLEKLKAKKQQQFDNRDEEWKKSFYALEAKDVIDNIEEVKEAALSLVRKLYELYPN